MLKQEHSPEQGPPARERLIYNSQEAGEILQIAAKLGSDTYSIEQLEAIAEEAGVSREAIHHAIEERKRQQQREEALRLERLSRRKRWGTVLISAIIVGLIAFAIMVAYFAFSAQEMRVVKIERGGVISSTVSAVPVAPMAPPMPSLDEEAIQSFLSNHHVVKGKNVEVHSQSNFPLNPDQFTLSVKDLKTNKSQVIRNDWHSIKSIALSPAESRIAFIGKDYEGISHLWVVNSDGTSLCSIVTHENGSLPLESSAKLAGSDLVWADENTLVLNADRGRMQVQVDKNNIPMAVQRYKPRI